MSKQLGDTDIQHIQKVPFFKLKDITNFLEEQLCPTKM